MLPRILSKKLKALVASDPLLELSGVPDELLNEQQRRVKLHTLAGTVFFDQQGAAQALLAHPLPAYFMDFETIQIAIPVWKGMRPYQQVPFQFSVHHLSEQMELSHTGYLDLLNHDPSESFANALIQVLGEQGTIFVYNAAFEKTRLVELEARFPQLAEKLSAIRGRIIDLLPIARNYYYHPSQQGSWSIKAVLPAIAPDLSYSVLQGVQHGGDAMAAYVEAVLPGTTDDRRCEIEKQLYEYCKLDTLALVRMWRVFRGADWQ